MTASAPGDPRIEELIAAVAALRADVRDHDERHTYSERKLGELDGFNQEQAAILAELLPQVRELEIAADTLGAPDDHAPEGTRSVVWALLSAEEAARAWDELASWVNTVAIPTLAPTCRQIPPCWPVHHWGRETLSWLHRTHTYAYGPHGSAVLVAEWHTRWVPAAYAMIDTKYAARAGYCPNSEHRSDRVESAEPLQTPDWAAWLILARDTEIATRRPTTEHIR
ncbi:hypothetical protein WIS52_20625 [Pseudonocardia nematodicida]|uniref:DUF4913 domain-containing protein n=1 Tax=Pseudonocardia nematodicida TaxID=1206997 RepID=A0ABV1KEV7_9PSEU